MYSAGPEERVRARPIFKGCPLPLVEAKGGP